MTNEITVPVRMSARDFRRFAVFNTLRRRRAWLRPLVFALIFSALAAVCFVSGRPQSGLLGAVLLVCGLGLPLVWLGTFFAQLASQAGKNDLKQPRLVYTVKLRRLGVHVSKEGSDLEVPWDRMYAACRVRGAVYLYVAPERAFLLPDGQGDASAQEIWAAVVRHMPEGRCHLYGAGPFRRRQGR